MTRIAIAGAGLAGLALARALADRAEITLFEKARGVGGRMATRYADSWQFDHGAQFFTAQSEAFQAFLAPLIERGTVARWDARFAEFVGGEQTAEWQWDGERPHYVGAPKMNALAKYLAADLDVRLGTRIATVEWDGDGWALNAEDGARLGRFDWFVSTAPAPQGRALMPSVFAHRDAMGAPDMRACYALMMGFEDPLPVDWDAAHVGDADISWMSVNSSKPGRDTAPSLLVHSTNAWAEAHLEDDPDTVTAHLLAEASRISGHDLAGAAHIALHRWRYANLPRQEGSEALLDPDERLAACGDWCIHGRVEAAFTSATALAERMRALLQDIGVSHR
ncbi:NAD(P)-binding protein [Parasphingopyxis algicola]|uniref:NAD(P)/FAD-dependent oxidoreductase n=1 Tax=Parasphingopyxis algicola TaxID=2026624 RepID=UPI0015A486B9|nr:FAD-dependent oxidoreductase [Parasphingopyxis algicola]QLC25932.1 NAD(P)-binding protein [Parasphingopyxis algicola]